MIDSVRNTVLALLNKNNYGYLSPSDFNLYAKQAQLELFLGKFPEHNEQTFRENLRKLGSAESGLKRKTEAEMNAFFEIKDLIHNSANKFFLPSLITTGDELYRMEKVLCYTLSGGNKVFSGEAEEVSHSRITTLLQSHHTAPSVMFPAFVIEGASIAVYPTSFNAYRKVEGHYYRMPKAPKWTYKSLLNGEPMFDQTATDYQDFELGSDEETNLVIKICQYAGLEIRDADVYKAAVRAEVANKPADEQTQL